MAGPTRIIWDSTNPENPESMLYLKIIEVNGDVPIPEMVDNMVPYLNLSDHPDIELAFKNPLATLTIEYGEDIDELLMRAPKKMRAYYEDEAGDLNEDDEYIVAIQTIYLELMAVTGAKGVHWPYF